MSLGRIAAGRHRSGLLREDNARPRLTAAHAPAGAASSPSRESYRKPFEILPSSPTTATCIADRALSGHDAFSATISGVSWSAPPGLSQRSRDICTSEPSQLSANGSRPPWTARASRSVTCGTPRRVTRRSSSRTPCAAER